MKDQLENPTLLKDCGLFQIYFVPLVEYIPLRECFDDAEEDFKELERKIDRYDLQYFCAKVYGYFDGLEISSDFLGCCLYESFEDFYNGEEYIKEMIETVENEGIEYLKRVKEKLSVL